MWSCLPSPLVWNKSPSPTEQTPGSSPTKDHLPKNRMWLKTECQPEETEVLPRNTWAHSISSLLLNAQLKHQGLCWGIRRPRAVLQVVLGSNGPLSCHLGLVAGCGTPDCGEQGCDSELEADGEPLVFSWEWRKQRGPTWRKAKVVHYLFNFSLFPQSCTTYNGQRRGRFGLH